jgi:uroporphyrinogen-III synthase
LRPIYLVSKTPYEGVIHIPVLTISFLNPPIDFTQYEGVVFTSKQGIEALKNYSLDWSSLKCIAVSKATAQYAEKAGAKEVEIADGYGVSIPDVLNSKVRSGKWLYLRPKVIASDWVEHPRSSGIIIDEAIVYETICNDETTQYTIQENGILIFTSPSSIRCFLQNHRILSTQDVVVIGTTTQNALPQGTFSHLSDTTSVQSAVDMARQIANKN